MTLQAPASCVGNLHSSFDSVLSIKLYVGVLLSPRASPPGIGGAIATQFSVQNATFLVQTGSE
jgi:hypothetical protein